MAIPFVVANSRDGSPLADSACHAVGRGPPGAALYLASAASKYTTGIDMVVDGGMLLA